MISFVPAQSYLDAGMKLLGNKCWQSQYSLSLELYEMAATTSCMQGDTTHLSNCLDQLFSHAKNFNDKLQSNFLLVKLLTSSSRFEEAQSNCLQILKELDNEIFPPEASLPLVLDDLCTIQLDLRDISYNKFALLPRMTDQKKLNSMKWMNMALGTAQRSNPLLLPIISCRMVKVTLSHGFCDESIVGEYFMQQFLHDQSNLLATFQEFLLFWRRDISA